MGFYFKRKFFLTLPNAIVLIIKRYCHLKTVFNNSSIQNVKKFIANLKDQLATICLIFERYDNFYTKPYCFFFNFKNSASIKHPPPPSLSFYVTSPSPVYIYIVISKLQSNKTFKLFLCIGLINNKCEIFNFPFSSF